LSRRKFHSERLNTIGSIPFDLFAVLQMAGTAAFNTSGEDAPTSTGDVFAACAKSHRFGDLKIPRDVWISRVLRNVGYGVVQVRMVRKCRTRSHDC
jgi:hypothetical protein